MEKTIDDARALLKQHITDEHLLMHSRESEVIMRALAERLGEDQELWAMTGLLHDLDFQEMKETPDQHGLKTCEILQKEGFDDPAMLHAIKAHNESHIAEEVKRESKLDFCLAAAENITGLIIAYVLMKPDKKLEGTKVKSITKKLKDKSFAANVNRDYINDIEKAGLERGEFIELAFNAMTGIADELGF